MKQLLLHAKHEITTLRRQNDRLEAQMKVVRIFGVVSGALRLGQGEGMAPDVLWEIDQALQELEEQEDQHEST